MKRVWWSGTQPGEFGGTGGVGVGRPAPHGATPVFPWVRTGNPAAATAAGLVEVWSSIRLLITRGCESMTVFPAFFCAYEVDGIAGEPGPKKPAPTPSAVLNSGVVRRGKGWSAEATVPR